MSAAVEKASNNWGNEARIASATELPQITRRDTWKRFTFSIFCVCFILLVKDRIFWKVFYDEFNGEFYRKVREVLIYQVLEKCKDRKAKVLLCELYIVNATN